MTDRLTKLEQDVLKYVFARYDREYPEDSISIELNTLGMFLNFDRETADETVIKVFQSILRKGFSFQVEFSNTTVEANWLSGFVHGFDEDSGELNYGTIKIKVSPYVLSLYDQLSDGVFHLSMMKHRFSSRLFRKLSERSETHATISPLRTLVGLEDHEYQLWADFKRQILKSLKEIETVSGKKYEMLERKEGKKVVGVVFLLTT